MIIDETACNLVPGLTSPIQMAAAPLESSPTSGSSTGATTEPKVTFGSAATAALMPGVWDGEIRGLDSLDVLLLSFGSVMRVCKSR